MSEQKLPMFKDISLAVANAAKEGTSYLMFKNQKIDNE